MFMPASEGLHTRERNLRTLGSALVATGALAIAGCGNTESKPDPTRDTSTVATETQAATTTSKTEARIFTFSDLGSASPIIQVYPGVGNEPADKKANGTYTSGDTVPAECKAEGRTVHSDTSSGEVARTSDDWIRITGTQGETEYATSVYSEKSKELLTQLPDC